MSEVTVGVPVWNGERHLEACLRSLLEQTDPPDAIIVSDNASTDRSLDIARGVAAAEPTIQVIGQDTNIGAAGNFNALARAAGTPLFAWLPHDDEWSSTLLAEMKAAHREPDVALAYGTPTFIDADGEPTTGPEPAVWSDAHDPIARLRELFADPHRSHLHVCIPVLGLVRRDFLLATGMIRPYGGSDKVLIVDMALRGRLVPVEAAFRRRVHESSSVQANPDGESRRRWFDPDAAGPAMPESRLLRGYLHAARHAPLPARDRALAAALIMRSAARGRRPRVLAGEGRHWARYRLGRLVRRVSSGRR